uniref:Uncharacterized protein n=1 Tax=Arundo donax TaxID=35708 RepID=A0A0A9HPT7_ARUDO
MCIFSVKNSSIYIHSLYILQYDIDFVAISNVL